MTHFPLQVRAGQEVIEKEQIRLISHLMKYIMNAYEKSASISYKKLDTSKTLLQYDSFCSLFHLSGTIEGYIIAFYSYQSVEINKKTFINNPELNSAFIDEIKKEIGTNSSYSDVRIESMYSSDVSAFSYQMHQKKHIFKMKITLNECSVELYILKIFDKEP